MRRALYAIAAIVALVLILLLVIGWQSGRLQLAWIAVTQAQGAQATAEGQAGAAGDAIGRLDNSWARAAASEDRSERSQDEIRQAPGADAPVDPGFAASVADSLCFTAAYSDLPGCDRVRDADPQELPAVGPGSDPAG